VLLPERTFAFAMAKFPAEVATTASTLLLMLTVATSAFAQGTPGNDVQNVPPTPKNPLEKRLHSEIVCTCGCRRALDNCGMPNCGGHAAQSEKVRQLMAEGKDHDAIIATFVRDFGGQDILIEPKPEGFNRLAWLFPYAIGGLGAIGGVFMVRKWSRRAPPAEPTSSAAGSSDDPALQARLDRELENLD
jgi:cytochrome c-type biogenesis protein CcmH/NrfF